ncbi:right-handed parallel beta-helix repeat-containing protein [Aquimarina algiphila]|uniref:right-handed parallel beta-helix repeat-containing protein n=1 Tax=Aquimarina algiphila TaxID=2047982 RepID=UPI00248FACEE|nr:right-handed parallel beta-helix repeat-containing protein [Aquimarina algiphila]
MIAPRKILLFALFNLISFLSFSRDIYVAKGGNDLTNTGAIDSPYATITKAADEAVAGDIVYIREGTYEETLRPANSGTAGNPIVFTSFPGEKVIISAMQSLNGWTNDSGSIYKTTIPFASLGQENFVMNENTAMDLARWPNNEDGLPFTLNSRRNSGGSDGSDATFNGRVGFLTSGDIPNIDWTGGSLFFYGDRPGSGWLAWKEFITSSSSGRVNFNITKNSGIKWIYTFHPPADKGDFYLEGVKGALDYQNEWWFDTVTSELFIQLPGGAVPQDGLVRMRRRRQTINLNSRNYIEIRNLAVFGGTIELKTNSNNNKLYGVSSFYGNHTQGIFTGFNAGKPSVEVNGTRNIIEKCEIAFSAATGMRMAGSFNELKNNYIHDFNYLGSYDAPLVARGGNDNKIMRNTIFNGGRDGINYNGQRCEIAYNDVSYSNLIADDCALFYTVGRQPNTEIHHNWFHDAASSGTKTKAAGIYLDNDAESFSVHHNVVWNTEWTAVQINWDGKDIDIFNNTFWNNSGEMGAWHLAGTAFSNVNVWNNLGDKGEWEPQSDKQNNLVVTSDAFGNASNSSFILKSNSEAVDAGRVIDGITDGFSGDNPDVGAYESGGDNWVAGIDWNTKLGPAGLGCYGLPGEDCIALPENDDDKDGVDNANDVCPNTPVNDTVDSNGCTIFTLPPTNFSILSAGQSCVNGANGSITITANENHNYTAEIKENSATKAFVANTATVFDGLSGGTYTVCIKVDGQASYEQCFSVVVNAPTDLKVASKVDTSLKEISLNLEGGKLYRVELNNEVIVTDKNQITLALKNGKNTLLVKTDKDCQGIHKESINVGGNGGVYTFPNPVKDILNIVVAENGLGGDSVTWELFSFQGKRILYGQQHDINVNMTIDMSVLANGSYILKVSSSDMVMHEQIIKN